MQLVQREAYRGPGTRTLERPLCCGASPSRGRGAAPTVRLGVGACRQLAPRLRWATEALPQPPSLAGRGNTTVPQRGRQKSLRPVGGE